MGTTLYIGGLPFGVKERDIEDFFRDYGTPSEISIYNGYGFVVFEDLEAAAQSVLNLDEKYLCGKKVKVQYSNGSRRRDEVGGRGRNRISGQNRVQTDVDRRGWNERTGLDRHGTPTRTDFRLIVQNLPFSVSWQELKDHMRPGRPGGKVTFANAHHPKISEGVVEFSSYRDMMSALEQMDGSLLGGQRISLIEDKSSNHGHRSRSNSPSRLRSHSRSRSKSKSANPSHPKSARNSADRQTSKSPPKSPSPFRFSFHTTTTPPTRVDDILNEDEIMDEGDQIGPNHCEDFTGPTLTTTPTGEVNRDGEVVDEGDESSPNHCEGSDLTNYRLPVVVPNLSLAQQVYRPEWIGPEPSQDCQVFVWGMRKDTRLEDLVRHMQLHGAIHETRLIMDADTRYEFNLEFAFVVYKTPQEALATVSQLNGVNFQGRSLTIQLSFPYTLLLVRHIATSTTCKKLLKKFQEATGVPDGRLNLFVPKDHHGKTRDRDFGVLVFASKEDAIEANRSLRQKYRSKHDLVVGWADPKEIAESASVYQQGAPSEHRTDESIATLAAHMNMG